MFRNPWFMLVIGLIVGLCLGYVLAERQPVPPAGEVGGVSVTLPETHPQMPAAAGSDPTDGASIQIAELQQLLAQSPGDTGLLVALANTCFDADRWEEARMWYEQALEKMPNDVNVLTDLAVVYRNLDQGERAMKILDEVVTIAPEHWQAWYNRVVVLHFDLHRHDEAVEALEVLEGLAAGNPQIPDISDIGAQVRGS